MSKESCTGLSPTMSLFGIAGLVEFFWADAQEHECAGVVLIRPRKVREGSCFTENSVPVRPRYYHFKLSRPNRLDRSLHLKISSAASVSITYNFRTKSPR
ncbi:hypothetical protein BO82DRAFT_185477 [Aspergillus uvarum CBS 121591]|uniref:Uncharacterized protein n=1 Tax=Aspergillus uvarum CBS 121591 TaxID=1448315 RepID=A0A319CLZ7_9EURO|nr:hypothetical protein BO82DRAFT_185477 [Aspergillus uvarum CBS 121591]PYH85479.1 hypothetical protein BO82DRAFT_185477 [Aspergillus uvarum CBS 121591]